MANSDWPRSMLFTRDGMQVNFASPDEVGRWTATERSAWAGLTNGSAGNVWANAMNQNAHLLQPLPADCSIPTLQRLANEYRPSGGTLYRYVSRIQNTQVRWATYGEIVQPGSTGAQQGADFAQARALAVFYHVIGSNLVTVEQAGDTVQSIRAAVDHVNQLRESDRALVDRFEALLARCDVDWTNKIQGFETRTALAAPRTYWNLRAERHNFLAAADKRTWLVSVLGLVALILVAATLNLVFPSPRDIPGEIASTIQRLIFFGSLLAVAVWWLRQTLRDVRMHEHFAEDAAERATMIETYAAMRGEGLQDKDFSLILAALYRPAAGNLTDDSGPVLPTETFLKALAEVTSKK